MKSLSCQVRCIFVLATITLLLTSTLGPSTNDTFAKSQENHSGDALFNGVIGNVDELIAAISAANDESSHPGPDTLTLAGGIFSLTEVNSLGGPDGPTGLPSITSEITIDGNGAIIERSENAIESYRIFHIAQGGSLSLNQLTIKGGYITSFPPGGGIFNSGTLELIDTTVNDNKETGIYNLGGSVILINSTVSGNEGVLGGGITGHGIQLINSTVSENIAGFGGGIYGSVEMVNTIVANNEAHFLGGDCSGGQIKSMGHNMDSDGTCDLYATGDITYIDPLLGPLQDNGGPTETHALLSGSPAINAGDDSICPNTDQRGNPRPQGPECDVGAYEADANTSYLKLDQSNTFPDGGLWSIQYLGPVGQEFVPMLPTLDIVELWIENDDIDLNGELQVIVRENFITGPVLGTSSIVNIPSEFAGVVSFNFPTTVVLIPGNLYVIEVIVISGPNIMIGWTQEYPDRYPFGEAIVLGEPAGIGVDLWFREWVVVRPVIPLKIDIKPGSDPNSINCQNEKGVITVALLTSDYFDAMTVDHNTVVFEGASETHVDKRSGQPRRHEEDVDGDGDMDLVFHFRLGNTSLTCDSSHGILTGETVDGVQIEGIDSVQMVNHK